MNRKRKLILGIVILLALVAAAIPVYISKQHTTFRAEVTDHMTMLDKFDRLEITRFSSSSGDREEVIIKDAAEIQDFLKDYKDIELKKINQRDTERESPYYYELRLMINKEEREINGFGITLYNKHSMTIYNGTDTRDKLQDYKVSQDMNWYKMERLFEGVKEEGS
ncbi:hypothetical protein N6H13_15380 [Paenibacillus sp. CC-CFT742]|uniref:hypothetical protein n=1 Tax=Paenibacillus illinoisensis TaxID=59845 RepID=UPI0025783373|nr:hypothetical protein [Paenibacillus sp. CC-CFT742]WJH31746.1 hypothetical protein N6H13_15380 [Paenibacillus sp. CC-CFT742]